MKAVSFLFLAAVSFAKASYWLDGIKHQGISPFNPDTSYSVYRNVMGYGAKGDGGMKLEHTVADNGLTPLQ